MKPPTYLSTNTRHYAKHRCAVPLAVAHTEVAGQCTTYLQLLTFTPQILINAQLA
jgi:hypothetical protein